MSLVKNKSVVAKIPHEISLLHTIESKQVHEGQISSADEKNFNCGRKLFRLRTKFISTADEILTNYGCNGNKQDGKKKEGTRLNLRHRTESEDV